MCIYSGIGPAFDPSIPDPHAPRVNSYWPWGPVPNTGNPISPEDLRILLDSFTKAVQAAKAADKATGQPDCVDPEKIKLEERVAELERRLDAMTQAGAHR